MSTHVRSLLAVSAFALLLLATVGACSSDGFTPPTSCGAALNVAGKPAGYPRNQDGSFLPEEERAFAEGCLERPAPATAGQAN